MADLSELGPLEPATERTMADPMLDEPRPAPPRYTPFHPRRRGSLSPTVGDVSDPAVLDILAGGGAGWLNPDGRVLANGAGTGMDAMRQLPEAASIFKDWHDAVAECDAAYKTQWDEALAGHLAAGKAEAVFRFDDAHFDAFDPECDAEAAIAALGWIRLELRQDRGVKEIACPNLPLSFERYERPLAALARSLDCRIVAPSPRPEPDILFAAGGRKVFRHARLAPTSSPRREGPAAQAPGLARIPGFRSQDPSTGAVEFEGRARITLLPDPSSDDDEAGPTFRP